MNKCTSISRLVHPEEAERILLTERFSNQRTLRHWWAEHLAKQMERGHWIPGSPIYLCGWKGKRYLVNGQHTLSAIVITQQPQFVTMMELEVSTWQEVREWYSRFDHILARSEADRWRALEFPQKYELTNTQTAVLSGAMKPLLSGFTLWGNNTRSNDYLSPYLRDHEIKEGLMAAFVEEARQCFADMTGTSQLLRNCLYRSAVFAIALVTYRYTGIDATDFWRMVAHDSAPRSDHPSKVLVHFLLSTPDKKHSKSMTARYVASAWNAAYEERTLKQLHARPLDQPILIAGTPYDGASVLRHLTPEGQILAQPQVMGVPSEAA